MLRCRIEMNIGTRVCVFAYHSCLTIPLLLCRSQDKGFHVENALLHVFTRSLPYTSAQMLKVEEAVEGEKVQYNIPAELSDYIFRYWNTQSEY